MGEDCSVWHNAVIRGDEAPVSIGNRTNIQDLVMIHTGIGGYGVTIGNATSVGHSAILHGCTIGNECTIGMGSIIMNGAMIGDHCIVGAGSLVTEHKTFPENSLILGRPAKVVRPLSQEEIQNSKKNAEQYIQAAVKELEEESYNPF